MLVTSAGQRWARKRATEEKNAQGPDGPVPGFSPPPTDGDVYLKLLTAAVSSSFTSKTVYSFVICSRS